jgi:hypothetical protein
VYDLEMMPGEVLVRNVNNGIDTQNQRFQLLYNVDSKLEIRCKVDFKDTRCFSLEKGHVLPDIFRIG